MTRPRRLLAAANTEPRLPGARCPVRSASQRRNVVIMPYIYGGNFRKARPAAPGRADFAKCPAHAGVPVAVGGSVTATDPSRTFPIWELCRPPDMPWSASPSLWPVGHNVSAVEFTSPIAARGDGRHGIPQLLA